MTALLDSTRGEGLRVEEQNQRAGLDQVAEPHGRAVLIEQLEVVDDVAFVHVHSSAVARTLHRGPAVQYGRAMADGFDPVRELALALPETNERVSHGMPSFFIRDKKLFCSCVDDHHGDGGFGLWVAAAPGVQEELVGQEPERFYRPPYVGHRGWVGVRLDVDVDWGEIGQILEDAYRQVAPKTLAKLLDADT